jgi:hypothetical protein
VSENVIRITIEVPIHGRFPEHYADEQHRLLNAAVDSAIKALRAAAETAEEDK